MIKTVRSSYSKYINKKVKKLFIKHNCVVTGKLNLSAVLIS